MAGSVLHYILDWEACEFHCCTMRLYLKHHFIYQKLIGSHIAHIFIFYCYAEAFFEYFFLLLTNYGQKRLFTSFRKRQWWSLD